MGTLVGLGYIKLERVFIIQLIDFESFKEKDGEKTN